MADRFGDIEGGSELRQGYPATHRVFGIPQTINSACFTIVEAINKARELSDVAPNVLEIVFGQCPLHTRVVRLEERFVR